MFQKTKSIMVVVAITVLIFGVGYTIIRRSESANRVMTQARQELSKKLLDICSTSPNDCPKNQKELKIFAPDLYNSIDQYTPINYQYDKSKNHWQMGMKLNDTQIVLHDSTSEYVVTGEITTRHND